MLIFKEFKSGGVHLGRGLSDGSGYRTIQWQSNRSFKDTRWKFFLLKTRRIYGAKDAR